MFNLRLSTPNICLHIFFFIDQCSSQTSCLDDNFIDVVIKEEPLESFDVSCALIFFFFIYIYVRNIITELYLNIARSSQFSG